MKAATFSRTGPAREVLRVEEVSTPEPGAGEVRVRIAASGVNPSDVKRRNAAPTGSPAEFPVVIPHSDGAGTIDAVGPGVNRARVGERVWLWNAQYRRAAGTAAESTVVPEAQAVPLPASVDFSVGACLGIPALTAYHAIALDGSQRGQTLLVQGGAGAVAFYAIQFAKAGGARVIGTVSSDAKADIATRAGADHVVNYKADDFIRRVGELTNGAGVDRIIEVDVAANARLYPSILKEGGKAVIYGTGSPDIRIPNFIWHHCTLQFINVYKLAPDERAQAIAALDAMLRAGTLVHRLGPRFDLDHIIEAHEAVEGGSDGNVIVEP